MLKRMIGIVITITFLFALLPNMPVFAAEQEDLFVQLLTANNKSYEMSAQMVAKLVTSPEGQRPYVVANITEQNAQGFVDALVAINANLGQQKDMLKSNLIKFSAYAKTHTALADVLLQRFLTGIDSVSDKTIDISGIPAIAKAIEEEVHSINFYMNFLKECNKSLKEMNISEDTIFSSQNQKLIINTEARKLYSLKEVLLDSADDTLMKKVLEDLTEKLNGASYDGERVQWINLLKQSSLLSENNNAEFEVLLQKLGHVVTPADILLESKYKQLEEVKTDAEKAAIAKDLLIQAGTFKIENTGNAIYGENAMTNLSEELLSLATLNVKNCASLLKARGITLSESAHLTLDTRGLDKIMTHDVVLASSFVKKAQSLSVDTLEIQAKYGTLVIQLSKFVSLVNDGGVLNITFGQKNGKQVEKEVSQQADGKEMLLVEILSDGNEIAALTDDGAVKVKLNIAAISRTISPQEIQAISREGVKKPATGCVIDGGNLVFNVGKEVYYTTIFRFSQTGGITFNDLPSSHWAKQYVDKLVEQKVLSGMGDGKFNPDGNVTREQFAKILVEAFKLKDESATTVFSDVSSNAWYTVYVASAQNKGIINGVGNNQFGVGQNITRQDMAVMLVRAAKIANVQIKEVKEAMTFADVGEITSYAVESVTLMQKADIISGLGDNRFAPKDFATRAQAAKMIYKLLY